MGLFDLGGISEWGTHVGDGGGTTYNIAHSMTSQPDYAIVIPASVNAAAPFHISINSTNIVVTYLSATTSGANSVSLHWMAGRKYTVREQIHSILKDSIGDEE